MALAAVAGAMLGGCCRCDGLEERCKALEAKVAKLEKQLKKLESEAPHARGYRTPPAARRGGMAGGARQMPQSSLTPEEREARRVRAEARRVQRQAEMEARRKARENMPAAGAPAKKPAAAPAKIPAIEQKPVAAPAQKPVAATEQPKKQ